jgi:opacity protein-like surface antigen
MKKFAFALAALCLMAIPSTASAATAYVRASAGAGFLQDARWTDYGVMDGGTDVFSTGSAFDGAFGVGIGMFRIEAAMGYQYNALDRWIMPSGEVWHQGDGYRCNVSIATAMANIYADFNRKGSFSPYVMGGIGGAEVQYTWKYDGGRTDRDSDRVFAWQVGAGVGYRAAEHFTLDLGYRYLATADVEALEESSCPCASSRIMLGARYDF